ncbi:hypothetical protein E4U30_002141 [Claviceps sp. LM220 group G6]|nr:hypothetical protein E4U15_002370 [Claviceps sp. LM218 group G6]KAG6095696.1 hypothetical protein E4U30_002141 [Claviceps sp. LM220 group G6]KAG6097247.1 hypothetical protein E4U31_005147 [Claviceps sp. LM219 group G6]KAG6106395.1 hypothetical protein E4U14_004626 [Claviceps sp. LM454 group G7]
MPKKTGEPQLDHPPASRELSEEPEKEATAIRIVKGEDDLCPGAFPNDEHRVVARLSTEIADDSFKNPTSTPKSPSTEEMAKRFRTSESQDR